MTDPRPGVIAETPRLQLRPVGPGDEAGVYALLSDERVVRTTLFPVFASEQQARDLVARAQRQLAAAPPARLAFAVVERSGGELVGLCGLVFKPELRDAEAWYLLRPDRWGRGLASEAARALVEHAFAAHGLHRVWASCLPENGASVRVLEKLGFRREGLLRQNLPIQGAWRDTYLYAVLADEWAAPPAAGAPRRALPRAALAGALALALGAPPARAQDGGFGAVRAEADFGARLRPWDGFGFNYVETAQTFDHARWPQDYGGFRFLDDAARRAVADSVFGDAGLRVALVKMFLDPLHQRAPGGPYDHRATTAGMRAFVRLGLERTRARGDSLRVITTLYGPPAYMTRQRHLRGRDLDPARRGDLADYLVDWARFLDREGFPVRFVSLHNEGEDWYRWPRDGGLGETDAAGHDYNLFWPPGLVAEMLPLVRARLDRAGLRHVGVTNGEPTNWYRLPAWGYAAALAADRRALGALALVTSHGFYVGAQEAGHWFGPHSARGVALLRERRPGLHAWTTSTAWDRKAGAGAERRYVMDAHFAKEVHGAVYEVGLNGLIPWAGVQNASQWNRPDPNPGTAVRVYDDGTWAVTKAYYYYKQLARAGAPGTHVAHTAAMSTEVALLAFAGGAARRPDAVAVINVGAAGRRVAVRVRGTAARAFRAFRTTGEEAHDPARTTARRGPPPGENYRALGVLPVRGGVVEVDAPANSVTTLFAER